MVMPTPERLPPPPLVPPVATPTPTPSVEPLMTPATQTLAPPAAPTAPPPAPTGEVAAKLRRAEVPMPEEERRPLTQWEFLGGKWTVDPTTAYQEYFGAQSSDRARWDEDYEAYINDFAGVAPEGEAAPIFSPEEERMLTDLTNAIKVGSMDEGQAWKKMESYWAGETTQSRRAEEAGRRGETMLAGAFPGSTLPLTGPGGMGAKLQEQYGLPDLTPAVKGIPMGDALGVFGQAQTQMGLPETLGPISPPNIQLPNWQQLGQTMPQFGGRNFFEQLLQEGRSTGF